MKRQRSDGLLEKLPWWDFVDWADDFDAGVPPQDNNGGSAAITLQFVEALQYAAEMEATYGDARRTEVYRDAAARATQAIRTLCWNQKYGLIADTPAQTHYSQHANILGIWLDVIPPDQQKTVLMKVLSASEEGIHVEQALPAMSKATYYFRFLSCPGRAARRGWGTNIFQCFSPGGKWQPSASLPGRRRRNRLDPIPMRGVRTPTLTY